MVSHGKGNHPCSKEIHPTTGPVSSTMLYVRLPEGSHFWDGVSWGTKISGPAVPACVIALPDYIYICSMMRAYFFHYMSFFVLKFCIEIQMEHAFMLKNGR